jgi:hypothetical protein
MNAECTSECDHTVGIHWSPEDIAAALAEDAD